METAGLGAKVPQEQVSLSLQSHLQTGEVLLHHLGTGLGLSPRSLSLVPHQLQSALHLGHPALGPHSQRTQLVPDRLPGLAGRLAVMARMLSVVGAVDTHQDPVSEAVVVAVVLVGGAEVPGLGEDAGDKLSH